MGRRQLAEMSAECLPLGVGLSEKLTGESGDPKSWCAREERRWRRCRTLLMYAEWRVLSDSGCKEGR